MKNSLDKEFHGNIISQHNTTQHNTTQHNTTQHNTTQHNTTQLDELVKFWNPNNFYENSKIHKDDYDCLKEYIDKHCENFESFIFNFLKNPENNKIQPDLYPEPYVGNLKEAKIFILGLNPGLQSCTYYCHQNEAFKKALEENLLQRFNTKFPFIFLNPDFLWTDGGQYWFRKFTTNGKSIVENLNSKGICPHEESLSFLSKNIASLEIFPYHSRNFKIKKSVYENLPSVKKMKSFIEHYVITKAKNNEVLLIILRKREELKKLINGLEDLENNKGNIFMYEPKKARSASLSSDSDAGKAIINFL